MCCMSHDSSDAELWDASATDYNGWDVLYLDPADGRYWERILPSSEMHGGGPADFAKHKFGSSSKEVWAPMKHGRTGSSGKRC